jgi:hypothetical protein
MFRSTEANVSCNNLSVAATHEHVNSASSLTRLQSIGGGRMLREPDRSSLDTPGPAALMNPGARAASPGYTDAGATHHQIPARRTLSMPRRIPLAEQGMRDPWAHSKT